MRERNQEGCDIRLVDSPLDRADRCHLLIAVYATFIDVRSDVRFPRIRYARGEDDTGEFSEALTLAESERKHRATQRRKRVNEVPHITDGGK